MESAQLVEQLKQKITQTAVPVDVKEKLQDEVTRAEIAIKSTEYRPETDKQIEYIKFVCELPWDKLSQDTLDLNHAKEVLNKNHYGLETIKERIYEYLSVLILNKRKGVQAKQPVLFFVGLAGSGKTTLAYSIAETLGRPLARIPFGGLASALQLRGESRVKPEAEPGLIMRSLKRVGVKNPVILLDELDRVAQEAKNDIMGVLVELLDPEQNMAFLDHYLGFPFDLSQVLFIATANNSSNISTAVLDRLELIEMPFYSDEQKITIGRDYLLPQALKNAGLEPELVNVESDVWEKIVRPLGFDGGIRSLRRNIDIMVRKIAKQFVEGNHGPFPITEGNVHEYIQGGG